MKYFHLQILLFSLVLFSCRTKQDDGHTANKTYQVGNIPGIDSFKIYTVLEKEMDSNSKKYNQADFRTNRGRIFMNSYTNNKLIKGEFSSHESLPIPCECYTEKDTIYINMAIGFFGGIGYRIKVYKDNFESAFFDWTDDVKPYKANIDDTAFTSFVVAENKYQYLILDKKPNLQQGRQLTGFLTFTSKNYYEIQMNDHLDSSYVTGKLYFTCTARGSK
jgi:hypothetical protein